MRNDESHKTPRKKRFEKISVLDCFNRNLKKLPKEEQDRRNTLLDERVRQGYNAERMAYYREYLEPLSDWTLEEACLLLQPPGKFDLYQWCMREKPEALRTLC